MNTLAGSVFVGRQREIGELKAALEDALSGRGRLVMLVGEPGIGKTRTATELAAHAQTCGAQVFWGRCYAEQGAPPYWPWIQAVRSYIRGHDAEQLRSEMGPGAADIAAIVSDVREQLPDLQPSPSLEDPDQARFRLFDSVTTFLKKAALRQPLVLVLDNLHWADKPSLLLLEFLAQELTGSRLLVVGTYRHIELSRQHPLSETLGELTREPLFQRVLLHGLGREEVGGFIEAVAGIDPPQGLVEAVHGHTEGNPLFMTEVVRLLAQEGELTPERLSQPRSLSIRIPEGVREVIGRRLNRLSQHCNQTLTIASVIGREFSLEELGHLVGALSQDPLLETLEEAVAARIIDELPQGVGRYQFSHALIRATLYDELTTARRARLHRQIGGVMEDLYRANLEPHLAELAHHFFEAARGGGVDKAIEYSARAGERADTTLAYEEAERYYQMALQVLEFKGAVDEAQRCRLLLALGEAQWKAGEFHQARETFQKAADIARKQGSPEALAHAALQFEEASFRPGLPGEPAVRLLREALEALGEGDSVLHARTLASLARALTFVGSMERALAVHQQAAAMARRVGDPSALFVALKAGFFARLTPEKIEEQLATTTEMLRLAEETDDRGMALEARLGRLIKLMELGDIQAADLHLEACTRLVEELRQPFYLYLVVSCRAMRAIFAGQFEEGERLAQQALAIGQRLKGQDGSGVFGMQMFTLRREQGRLSELAPAVRSFVQLYPASSTWRPGLALIYSELGLEPEARAEFERLATNDFTDLPKDALWSTCIAYLAEVCAFLGDTCRADTLYRLLLPYAGHNLLLGFGIVCYGSASRYLGLLAATMSRWQEAEQHFEDALAMNARMGAGPWLAHTQHQYAEMLLARGHPDDRGKALSLLYRALTTARELGMGSLEEGVTALQAQAESKPARPPEYPDGLSQREVEVLRLIAAGKSNREVAGELFISLNTVANHVKNIFNKIGATNRTEAAAYAIRHGLISE